MQLIDIMLLDLNYLRGENKVLMINLNQVSDLKIKELLR